MLGVTGWALATWAKLTAVLALAVGLSWWQLAGTGWFPIACTATVVAEIYGTRQLAREWAHEARSSWWWAR